MFAKSLIQLQIDRDHIFGEDVRKLVLKAVMHQCHV